VTSIGTYAFSNCSGLTSISLPAVTSIGNSAFSGTGIWNNTDNNAVVYADNWAVGYKGTITNVVIRDGTIGIGEYAFRSCSGLTTITLPNVTSIGEYAFRSCSGLTTITLPNVTSIGGYAFYDCIGLTEITLPNVTSIGEGAFYYCYGLTTITLPNVTSIGAYAFSYCSVLTSITIHSNVTSVGSYAFRSCSKLTIYVEASSKPSGWDTEWNYSNRPVVWGCTLSEDKSYVVSFTKTASSISYPTAANGISTPYREGYTFGGWATTPGGTTAAYTAANVNNAANGVTLYAIWIQK
jgi:uncharacterized repeat protein (TIGR02543 family)